MVSIRSLRTQQRAKSQCIKHIPPSMGWPSFMGAAGITEICQDHFIFGWGALWNGLHSVWCEPAVCIYAFNGEFDPGSGRTLAACLTHASRAERPFGVLERRTGE